MKYLLVIAVAVASCVPTRAPFGQLKSDPLPPQQIQPLAIKHPVTGCITVCGMYAPYVKDCEGLADAEFKALVSYSVFAKMKVPEMCRSLQGYSVYIVPGADKNGSWSQLVPPGRYLGLTYRSRKQIFIGTESFLDSALIHEMGHVFHDLIVKEPEAHVGWAPLGMCYAVNAVSHLKDDCADPEYQ